MIALVLALTLAADSPTLRLTADSSAFEAIGLNDSQLASLRALPAEKLASVFVVRVKSDAETLPMLGTYAIVMRSLRFEPRFPPAPGVTYRLTLSQPAATADVLVPKLDPTPRTSVTAIYPTVSRLPENTLRFYIHFSGPMNRKEIYRHVKLVRDDGQPVDYPFLEIEEQLWSADGTRLTLLCDPGRVKRGLVPREQDGPILEEGRRYTLTIDRNWEDADGRVLKETGRKTFDVIAPDDAPVDPAMWTLMPPRTPGTSPLLVRLAEPLDHALLARMVWVEDASGQRVEGKLAVGGGERVLAFAPAKPWKSGRYHLTIDTRLEDLCGNRVGEPFEVDTFRRMTPKIEARHVRRAFMIPDL